MTNEIYAEWKKMRNKVESASAMVYLEKNERTEKEYEEALEALAQYEKDNGIPLMADEAQVKAMLPKRNFDRVTASPEKLAEFIHCIIEVADYCSSKEMRSNLKYAYEDAHDKKHVELIRGNKTFDDLMDWLKQESTE